MNADYHVKKGGKKWAHENMVPSEAVFLKLINLKEEKRNGSRRRFL
jgi:hypothetical protein